MSADLQLLRGPGLRPTASTRTRTSPEAGTGRAASPTRSDDGGPGQFSRSARIISTDSRREAFGLLPGRSACGGRDGRQQLPVARGVRR